MSTGDLTTAVFERIAALDGTNYRSWAFSMKMLLKAKELWDVVEEDDDDDEDKTGEEKEAERTRSTAWKRKDQLALSSIALSLRSSEQEHIHKCVTAKDAWNRLKELYEGKGTHRFLSLLKALSTAKLEGTMTMKEYIRRVRQTADELTEIKCKFDQMAVIGFILNGLPDIYRYLVVNLESQIKEISYEELSARLIDEEKKLEESELGESEQKIPVSGLESTGPRAHLSRAGIRTASTGRPQAPNCGYCGHQGHLESACWKKETCDYCGRNGHTEKSGCRTKEFQQRKMGGGPIPVKNAFGGLSYVNVDGSDAYNNAF
jgi:ribosomal protein L9